MSSLLDEAQALASKRQGSRKLDVPNHLELTSDRILKYFTTQSCPVAMEMLCTQFEINMEIPPDALASVIMNYAKGPEIREIRTSSGIATKMTTPEMITPTYWKLVTVSFQKVFGVEIVFSPYKDPSRGFVIFIHKPDYLSPPLFYDRDLSRKEAINIMAADPQILKK